MIFDIPVSASHMVSNKSKLDWKVSFTGTQYYCHSICELSDCFLASPLFNSIPASEIISNIEISPNPFRNEISVVLPSINKEKFNIKLYNIQGNCVYESSIKNSSASLHLDMIPSGIYILELQTNHQKSIRKKLIKQ
jgi:hypothetical protein